MKMKHTMKRGFSLAVALCMVLSLFSLPGVTVARAVEGGLISQPLYSNAMDTANPSNALYPTNFTKTGQNASASRVRQDEDGTKYWYFATGSTAIPAVSYVYSENQYVDKSTVLRYSVKVDDSTANKTVNLPTLGTATKTRLFDLTLTNNVLTVNGQTKALDPTVGWYDVEVIVCGSDYAVYVNNQLLYRKDNLSALANATDSTVNFIIMHFPSGSSNAGFGIDNLCVYNYVPGVTFEAAADNYSVAVGEEVTPAWNKTEGSYISKVTYTSSDESIATVDENGVVTGVSAGEATITAAISSSYDMTVGNEGFTATTTVTVTGGEEEDSNIEFAGTNVTLENNLDMNFYVEKADLPAETANVKAVLTRTYANGSDDHEVEVPFAQWTSYGDYYYITYTGMTAKSMTDSVTVQIFDGDDQISEDYTDTIAAYAKRMFGSEDLDDKWDPVYAAMLKYGAAAQTTWNYGTGAMADADMTQAMLNAIPNVTANYAKTGSETYKGMTMKLENTIETQMVFSGISEGMTAEVSYTKYNAAQPTTFTVEFDDMVSYGGSIYGVKIDSLVVADVDSEITVTIMNGEDEVATATDCIAGYVTRMSNGSDVFSAIYTLGNAAYTAFTAN